MAEYYSYQDKEIYYDKVEKEKAEILEYEESLFNKEVHLIEHYPDYFKENDQILAICNAADPEFNLFRQRAKKSFYNQMLITSDEDGVSSYEEMVGILPDPSLSLDERKARVLARMNERLPYTEIRLQRMLAAIVGWGHFSYIRKGAFVRVILDETCHISALPVMNLLERVLPLNLYYGVTLGMTRNSEVKSSAFVYFGQELTLNPYEEHEVTTDTHKIYTSAHVSMEINKWQ